MLATAIARAERGEDPIDSSAGPWPRRICDTETDAPLLERVTSTVDYPATLGPVRKPREFTATLSDPDTACSAQIAAGVRGPDAYPLGCRYTQELDDFYTDGLRGFLACTLFEGHRGKHSGRV